MRSLVAIALAAWAAVTGCRGFPQPAPQRALLDKPGTLAQELAAAKRAGLPTTPKDLAVPPPAGRNAATYYRKLDALLKARPLSPLETKAIEVSGRPGLTTAEVETARRVLCNRRDVLILIHQAASCERCAFVRDYSLGPALNPTEYSLMKVAARCLRLESSLLWVDGRYDAATANAALGFRIAKHAASDPWFLGLLTAGAVDRQTVWWLSRALNSGQAAAGAARAVGAAVEREWTGHDLARAMGGEVVTGRVSLEIMRRGPRTFAQLAGESGAGKTDKIDARTWQPLVDSNGAYVLWFQRHAAAAFRLPWPEQRVALSRLEADLEERGSRNDLSVLLGTIVCPQVSSMGARHTELRASAACLRAGAAVLAWKVGHGALPDRLDQAITPVPADPFDLKPLRYRKEGAGFVVWSVGESGKFAGGTPTARPAPGSALFRWPRPVYMK